MNQLDARLAALRVDAQQSALFKTAKLLPGEIAARQRALARVAAAVPVTLNKVVFDEPADASVLSPQCLVIESFQDAFPTVFSSAVSIFVPGCRRRLS